MAIATAPGDIVATTGLPANGMSPMERRHLGALERRIANGLQTFREVGSALLEIRDQRLYRETHTSFEAYAAERWSLSRARAYQLIDSASVVKVLGDPDGLRNEAQARELVTLEPEAAQAVWTRVTEVAEQQDRPITASLIRRVRGQVIEHEPAEPAVPELSMTDRLVQDISRVGNTFQRWKESKPSAAERRRVTAATKALVDILSA